MGISFVNFKDDVGNNRMEKKPTKPWVKNRIFAKWI